MKDSILEQYLSVRTELLREKSELETRLTAITAVLNDQAAPPPAIVQFEETPAPKRGRRKRRQMSPEGRARIAEATRKRWAKYRREKNAL